ncbi:hypothetical protein B0H67DRAFT_644601 [Lasiosphaeris hirsuta]|uniref:Uncharacterized protein n=1 Tax=Lasiosphaeris hirsuta TaxID=260670 RepID=A0AA40DTC3_9PEZI|nr:hypothetical protein B0H67DRAFT_644601 [Lasiosphaeris hirsuta]
MALQRVARQPGIHFFSLSTTEDGVDLSADAIPAVTGLRILLPPRPRRPNDPLWWTRDEATSPFAPGHTGWFDRFNPSTYSARELLRRASESAVARALGVSGPADVGPGRLVVDLAADLICLQIPNRTTHMQSLGFAASATKLKYMEDAFPALREARHVAFEYRPRTESIDGPGDWEQDWMFGHDFTGEGYCYLRHHFPKMGLLYCIDYAIKLKVGRTPSPRAARFCGAVDDFVEVVQGDDVWEKALDMNLNEVTDYDLRGAMHELHCEHSLFDRSWSEARVKILARVPPSA